MRKYIHWLKIDTCAYDEDKQYKEIDDYLKQYPEAKATLYFYKYNIFGRVVKLECDQNYTDLDMMVNSMSNNMRRLTQKPNDIVEAKPFEIPEWIKKKLSA